MRLFRPKPSPPVRDGYADDVLADVVVRKTAALTTPESISALPAPAVRLATIAALAVGCDDRVLDFGGAAGLHYRVACCAFPGRQFRWAVVETPMMVSKARHLEERGLRFFTTIPDAREWLGGVDVMHSIGALQYSPDPERALTALVAVAAPLMLWAKLDLGEKRETIAQHSLLSANGPGPLPAGIEDAEVVYPLTRIREADFLSAHRGYRAVWRDGSSAFLFARH